MAWSYRGNVRPKRLRKFRAEEILGRGKTGTVRRSPIPAQLMDSHDNSDIIIKTLCRDCPEDSGGVLMADGRCKCMCTHFGEPRRKNQKCRRNIVNASNSSNSTLPNSISVDVITGSNNGSSHNSIDPFGHQLGSASFGYPIQIMLFSTMMLVSLLAIFFVGFCVVRRRSLRCFNGFKSQSRMEMKSGTASGYSQSSRLLPDRFINNPTYETTCVDLAIQVYSSDDIKLQTQIGQGCFGKVFKGEVNGEIMAIKMVHSEHSTEALREIETMASFSHPNILPLFGIAKSPEADSPWLLFEFMEHGDLASVLRSNFPSRGINGSSIVPSIHTPTVYGNNNASELKQGDNANVDVTEEELKPLQLTHEMLSNISLQIAEGMKYLSIQHFVHRDLAARNCLVSSTGVVKISDFGLSRDVYTCDYYKIGGSKLLPIRWMAPESILYGRFTLESDVWAYGTVLWEIYTWGRQPYYGHSNEEVVQLILDGVLLCPPSDCPPLIQEILAGCWKTESKDRFNFKQICEKFIKANGPRAPEEEKELVDEKQQNVNQVDESFHQTSSTAMESEYEIPRSANPIEYLQVV
ncbi:unnamed protein product [Orchesella dallaii]|uniref:Protein kinase domain-containing protein n=1 Tax=Orchesella dallaii TaxID=48710 RepID=A0ABP1Q7T5_9HEXA